MGLQFILGGSGSGKTTYILNELIKKAEYEKDKNYFLIVPEQSNMQYQKDIVNMTKNNGSMNIDILSFNRLAYKVFDELNIKPKDVLEDIGKSMVIRKILEENKDRLQVFKGCLKKQGFVDEVKSTLSELYQYDISKEKLFEVLNNTNENTMIHSKLSDILIIYECFEKFLGNHFVSAEKILDILGENIKFSNKLKDSQIYLDGFTGFTPVQYNLLEKIMSISGNITIAITISANEQLNKVKDYELFSLSKKTFLKLTDIAKSINLDIEDNIVLKENFRFKTNEELAVLEQNLFRYPYKPYLKDCNNISIREFKNPRSEAIYVSREIYRLIYEEKYRFKDISVVVGDMKIYQDELEYAFNKLNIPYFVDNKKNFLNNPCIESIRAVLNMIEKNFSYESVFRYLKTNMTVISLEDVDKLENYVVSSGIKGYKSWKKDFTKTLRIFTDEELKDLNQVRKKFINSIEKLQKNIVKKNSVKTKIVNLYEFMVSLNYQQKLADKRKEFESKNNLVFAKMYEQIYKTVIELFDKIVEIFDEDIITLKEFNAILDSAFSATQLGIIPPKLDQVVIGDIERTRLNNIKVLLFLGVNDGIIPKKSSNSNIISEAEREDLLKKGMEIAPTEKQNIYIEQFYLYLNLTKPSEKLYILYSNCDREAKSQKPSYLINRIQKIFTRLNVIKKNEKSINEINNLVDAKEYLINGISDYCDYLENKKNNYDNYWTELFAIFNKDVNNIEFLNTLLEAIFYRNQEDNLSVEIANRLYNIDIPMSVTIMENYASCPFLHFLKYGLGLEKRKEYKIFTTDMGNILHKSLEEFAKHLKEENKNWKMLSDSERIELTKKSVESATLDYKEILDATERNKYMKVMIERITERTIWALQEQLKKGEIDPYEFEFKFPNNFQKLDCTNILLENGKNLKLQGKIDRIDRYIDEENNKVYLKVIDYKSGKKTFSLTDLYYGLQIQLVVYMNAIVEITKKDLNKEVIPAGIFYYTIDDPIVKNIDENKIEEEILKELKLEGLVNSDEKAVKFLENSENDFISIKIRKTKDGAISGNSVASTKQFNNLGEFVTKKIKELGDEIFKGNIQISPYEENNKNSCIYCDYKAICAFDKRNKENKFRKINKIKNEDIWKMIDKENKEKEGK